MFRPAPLLALLLMGSPLFGQQDVNQQPSHSSSQNAPAVPGNRVALPPHELAKPTARTDLVLVPVIATDKSGKHVSSAGWRAGSSASGGCPSLPPSWE